MVKVSVIIPVYNAEKYLRQCLDSVVNQTLREIEILCVDDGSTDQSAAILAEFAAADGRFRLLKQENGGPGKARNTALSHAKGKYISFLDADDWFEPHMLREMYEKSEEMQADICICRTQRFDNESERDLPSEWMLKIELLPKDVFSPDEIADYLFQFTYGQVWDKLYRRSFLEETGIRFPEFRNSEDTAFMWMTLLSCGKIAVVPEVLVHYRVNLEGSVSASVVRQPEAPYEAFRLVYECLEAKENKALFRQSFLNWAMEYLVWHVCNMPDGRIRKKYYNQLHDTWFSKLEFKKNKGLPNKKKEYIRYLAVRYLPFELFSIMLTFYNAIANQVFSKRKTQKM